MNLINRYCIFKNDDYNSKRYFYLKDNGEIQDVIVNGNDNERFWYFENNKIILLNRNRNKTSELLLNEKITNEYRNEFIFFEGRSIFGPHLSLIVVQRKSDLWQLNTRFLMNNLINQNMLEVGPHTYGAFSIGDCDYTNKIIIGDYCSIAKNVKFTLRNHKTNLITTYPFDELAQFYLDKGIDVSTHITKNDGRIIIGNDVWIADDVTIMPGVVVGDGAVIGTGAIVTKDVPDYAIVAGVPAKIIRYRFNQEQIVKLKEIAWWNWDDKKVIDNLNRITTDDIDAFIKEFGKK